MQVTDKIQITNEDNMVLMSRYPDKYFDLAIVDPPYGIERGGQTETFTKNPKHKRKSHKQKEWDNEIPSAEYFNELVRVSKNQIIWGANYFIEHLTKGTMGWIFWYKGQEGLSMSDGEIAYTSFQKATRQVNINRGLIAQQGGSIHPTQKPTKLYKWLLDNYAKQGDKILDTHLGSGSIAIACHDYDFELTACELDKEYYDNAIERIKNHTAQIKMF
jgi:site-specific DNA-methyltransferase (adenine-specific)